jgi:hypothetical protein
LYFSSYEASPKKKFLFLSRPFNVIFVISVMVAFHIGHNAIHLFKSGLSLMWKAIARSGGKTRHSETEITHLSYTYTVFGYVKN